MVFPDKLKELDPVINQLAHPENIIRTNFAEILENFAKLFKLKEMSVAEVTRISCEYYY